MVCAAAGILATLTVLRHNRAGPPRTLYVVNYAHLDTQWRWAYPETIRDYLPKTVDRNVEYFRKYPSHVFNFSGASRYQMLKEYYPERLATVKSWVQKGRWFAAGNQWEECDVLVPQAESILRQILYGHDFFQRELGVGSTEFMLPDSFGFPASLPTILAHAHVRGFSTQKLTWDSAVGIPFNVGQWRGLDGSTVIAALNAGNYGAVHRDNLSESEAVIARLDENGKASKLRIDYLYNGVGDRGGAPHEISMRTLEQSVKSHGPVKVSIGAADEMFRSITEAQAAALPSYEGDLLLTEHSAGSITSQAFMKRLNRMNELLADAAERASVAAELLGGQPYPHEALTRAWQLLLRSQSHDTISGTSIPKAYEYAWNDEFIAMNGFISALTHAVSAVSRGLDTALDGIPIVVYNPLAIERTDLVEISVPQEFYREMSIVAVSPKGETLPTQAVLGPNGQRRLLFRATVPSVGFAVYGLEVGNRDEKHESAVISDIALQNERYRVSLNSDADVSSIYDLESQRELLAAPIRQAFQTEWPSSFPAWNMEWVDRAQAPRGYLGGSAQVSVIEKGPLRVSLQIEREGENSQFRQLVRLGTGDSRNRVEFIEHIDWLTPVCSLKATFPLTVQNTKATYHWGPGTVQRGNNQPKQFEVPAHGWFDLTDADKSYGVTVLSGAKYGSDKPADNTLRLTLLFTPATTYEYCEQRSQDFGRHEIAYALVGHRGQVSKPDAYHQAERFERPLMAFSVGRHKGPLGRTFSLLASDNPQIAVQAIKRAEDGRDIVLRLQELAGAQAETRLTMATTLDRVSEADALERAQSNLVLSGRSLATISGAYQLRTLRISAQPNVAVAAPTSVAVDLPYDVDGISHNQNRRDGDLDGAGNTLPAEMLPEALTVGGMTYRIGPRGDGQLSALRARGQVIPLPKDYSRLGLLMARVSGDVESVFRLGKGTHHLRVGAFNGFLGQWDNRVFRGDVQPVSYCINNLLERLAPAFLRTDHLAWYASHYHRNTGEEVPYEYSYLFSYILEIPNDERELILPTDSGLRIFALSVVRDDNFDARPMTSLWPELFRDKAFLERFGSLP